MANKVRYLTISRVAIELACSLKDADNKMFNQILFSCFQQLEDGQIPEYADTDNPVLNIALREAVAELETGYKNYLQRVNARKKPIADEETESAIDRRSTADQSAIDRQSTIEENRKEDKKTEESIGKGSQEGETHEATPLLLHMARKAGIMSEVEQALKEYGFTIAYDAFVAWKADGQKKGTYKEYLKGDSDNGESEQRY